MEAYIDPRRTEPELVTLMISPNAKVADQFNATVPRTRLFQILAELKSYPAQQTLEIRLRQFKPEVVLLDLTSDIEKAADVIRFVKSFDPAVQIVGLDLANDAESAAKSLRWGASEYLYYPFDLDIQLSAVARIRRLRQPDTTPQALGNVVVFSSAKPGSGASTLGTQMAFALERLTGQKVLLADFDLTGGAIGFYLKVNGNRSLIDALERAGDLDPATWSGMTSRSNGVDVLPSPEIPFADSVESNRLQAVIEYARSVYDWVVIDLPAIFQRISLLAISEADRAFLVSTSELPSLHLARKAVNMLQQLGFPKERYQLVINRLQKRDGISGPDIEKLFKCPVHTSFLNDYFSLRRVVTLGQPLGSDCELGKAIEALAGQVKGLTLRNGPLGRPTSPVQARAALN